MTPSGQMKACALMKEQMTGWRHIFKLDPERFLPDESLDRICTSGTDAILVGGTTGVTFDNTAELMSRIRRYELPCVLEVTHGEMVVPGFDLYLVPMVLNTPDAKWVTARQAKAMRFAGSHLPWEWIAAEGYIVLNPDSAVARLTQAHTGLDAEDIVAYARVADRLMRLPIVYIEYSGTYGDMAAVRQVAKALDQARLFYGGGIDSAAKAREALAAAHTIVVGNIVYDDIEAALSTVVKV